MEDKIEIIFLISVSVVSLNYPLYVRICMESMLKELGGRRYKRVDLGQGLMVESHWTNSIGRQWSRDWVYEWIVESSHPVIDMIW